MTIAICLARTLMWNQDLNIAITTAYQQGLCLGRGYKEDSPCELKHMDQQQVHDEKIKDNDRER